MRIMIVSDSHGQMGNITMAIRNEAPLDMLLHCGDAEGMEEEIAQMAQCPMYCVRGNNDYFNDLKKEIEVDIEGYKFLLTHGHYYYVSMGPERIAEEGQARGVDYVLFGHTHKPMIEKMDSVTLINPGSISYPRQNDRQYTYVIMDINAGKEVAIELKSL